VRGYQFKAVQRAHMRTHTTPYHPNPRQGTIVTTRDSNFVNLLNFAWLQTRKSVNEDLEIGTSSIWVGWRQNPDSEMLFVLNKKQDDG
jgi:hypothetical protein